MTTRQTYEKVTRFYCDRCKKEVESIYRCPMCGEEVCIDCKVFNQCKDCWETNTVTASIETSCTCDDGYESRNYTSHRLIFDNKAKWNDILRRFQGKEVNIMFEEVISEEISIERQDIMYDNIKRVVEEERRVKKLDGERRAKELEGDDPTKFLERCG